MKPSKQKSGGVARAASELEVPAAPECENVQPAQPAASENEKRAEVAVTPAPAPKPDPASVNQTRVVRVAEAINALHNASNWANEAKLEAQKHRGDHLGVTLVTSRF